jgi:hypothetical protein
VNPWGQGDHRTNNPEWSENKKTGNLKVFIVIFLLRFKLDLNDVFSLGWSCPIVSICALFFR